MNPLVEHAKEYALRKHAGQMYGDKPYSYHLNQVFELVSQYCPLDTSAQAAAWLHDVLEDTNTSIFELREEFGEDGFELVRYVFSVTGFGKNRKIRNQSIYTKLQMFPDAIAVKQADRLANARSSRGVNHELYSMYRTEYPQFQRELRPYGGSHELWAELDKVFDFA